MKQSITRERFIRLGAALGVSTVGASVLAGCGGGAGEAGSASGGEQAGGGEPGGSGDTAQRGPTTSGGSKKPRPGGQAIARVSEVPPGSAVKFRDSGNPALLVHLKSGDFVAYSAICTHQGCTVAYRGGQLACPCHGSVFDPANNGQVITPPAQQPLPQIPVEVRGGEVLRA